MNLQYIDTKVEDILVLDVLFDVIKTLDMKHRLCCRRSRNCRITNDYVFVVYSQETFSEHIEYILHQNDDFSWEVIKNNTETGNSFTNNCGKSYKEYKQAVNMFIGSIENELMQLLSMNEYRQITKVAMAYYSTNGIV